MKIFVLIAAMASMIAAPALAAGSCVDMKVAHHQMIGEAAAAPAMDMSAGMAAHEDCADKGKTGGFSMAGCAFACALACPGVTAAPYVSAVALDIEFEHLHMAIPASDALIAYQAHIDPPPPRS